MVRGIVCSSFATVFNDINTKAGAERRVSSSYTRKTGFRRCAYIHTYPRFCSSESSYWAVLYTNGIRELRDADPVRGQAGGTRTLGHRRTGRIRSIAAAELPGERRDSHRLFNRLPR